MNTADFHRRLAELGLTLPTPARPIASYQPAVLTGSLLVVSGQLPMREGTLLYKGKVPDQVTLEQAQAAARQATLNALAIVDEAMDHDWSRLERVVRVGVFVACTADFVEQAKVANGASDLLYQLLGEPGRHARAAVGVNVLPLDAPVEVELMAALRSGKD